MIVTALVLAYLIFGALLAIIQHKLDTFKVYSDETEAAIVVLTWPFILFYLAVWAVVCGLGCLVVFIANKV